MEIVITNGKGEGETEISAFDKALLDAGIANYNLITLSSIIPKDSKVIIKRINWNDKEYGNKLFVVLSENIEIRKNKEAWAGLGWVQDETGKGLLVEIKGESKEEVENKIKKSLENMQAARKKNYGKINYKIEGIKCNGNPVCALVCAVFKSEDWN